MHLSTTDEQYLSLLNKLINKRTKGYVKSTCCAGVGSHNYKQYGGDIQHLFPHDILTKGLCF